MPSPNIGIRVSEKSYKAIVKLARAKGTSISDVARQLLEKGLSDRPGEDELKEEMKAMRQEMEELVSRATKASAASLFFSRMAATLSQEAAHFVINEAVLDKKTRDQKLANWDKRAKELEEHFLKAPIDSL